MTPTIYIMCGAPGSGKSTTAQHLAARCHAIIICPDTLREQFPDMSNEHIFRRAHALARQALRARRHVVFDATNVQPSWRAPLIQAVQPFHPIIIAIQMTTPLEQCLAWHHQRQAEGKRLTLTDQRLTLMFNGLHHSPPELTEGFHSIILVDPTNPIMTPSR